MDKREELLKQYDTGQYLLELRNKKGISLAEVGKAVGVTATFLSAVERGVKMPSDDLIKAMADYWQISEEDLFQRYGKLPILTREELQEHPYLQDSLAELRRLRKKGKISDERVDKLFTEIIAVYRKHIEEVEGE